jgi:spoIIIJ-associated protein
MDNKERNQNILEMVCELLGHLNIEVKEAFVEDVVEEVEEGQESGDQVLVSLKVDNPAQIIGVKGRHLAALQTVLSLMVKNKTGNWVRVLVDVNNYREEQKERLEAMVKSLAQKVMETGKPVAMMAMSSYERRICHMVAGGIEGVVSESEGEGEERHIVLKTKV